MNDQYDPQIALSTKDATVFEGEMCKTLGGRILFKYLKDACYCGQAECARERLQESLKVDEAEELLKELVQEFSYHEQAPFTKLQVVHREWTTKVCAERRLLAMRRSSDKCQQKEINFEEFMSGLVGAATRH